MRKILILLALVLLIIAAFFVFKPVPKSIDNSVKQSPETESSVATSTIYTDITSGFVHTFDDGTHTISGKLTVPTPCNQISVATSVNDSVDPQEAKVNINVLPSSGICIQVIDERDVDAQFEAPENTKISLVINGKEVPFENK